MEIKSDKENPVTQYIDLDKVIAAKNPRLKRLLPRFVINYIKKTIHQDDLNKILRENQDRTGLDFVDSVLEQSGVKVSVKGIENLPVDGRWIIASNHPLGGFDGMALISVAGKINKNIVFPVNDLLMHIENMKSLFIPINKHGSNAGNARLFDETFASDKAILYFPAGLCSRKQHGQIADLEWKKSFLTKARKHQRDIVPCFIEGRNSNWFYNLAFWRSRLGIKANIEMFYLVDEMFRQRDKEIKIMFGKPISYRIFDKTNTDLAWAEKLRDYVYRMGKVNVGSFKTAE